MFHFKAFNLNRVAASMLSAEAARHRFLVTIDTVMVKALLKTKKIKWTPYKEGYLMRSISMENARYIGFRVAIAALIVSPIKYGKIQEDQHKTKGKYLYRAMLYAQQELQKRLKSAYVLIPGKVSIGAAENNPEFSGTTFESTSRVTF